MNREKREGKQEKRKDKEIKLRRRGDNEMRKKIKESERGKLCKKIPRREGKQNNSEDEQ